VNGDEIPGKDTRGLTAGDVVRTETPGGGGFGRAEPIQ
jgi:N-methylhydantoinase B/oxoprolinase/acetone carboxylase alpha subunit